MNVAVWDTYVSRNNGVIMHFDIVVPDGEKDKEKIYTFGKEYLATKGETSSQITSRECRFCHVETAPRIVEAEIKRKGYFIVEMENCY